MDHRLFFTIKSSHQPSTTIYFIMINKETRIFHAHAQDPCALHVHCMHCHACCRHRHALPCSFYHARFDKHHHSDSFKPRNSNLQLCLDWRLFEFVSQAYSCSILETGASNLWKLSYEACFISCSLSLYNDANALLPWIHWKACSKRTRAKLSAVN